jgi:putative ABC transport system permease protein
MIKNILILTYRYLLKYKAHALINVLGLAIGFTAFILVSLFVNYEYSWDRHNVNCDRVYRVQRHFVKAQHALDGNDISPHSRGITAKLLYPRYPEIENTTILKELNGVFLSSNNISSFYDNKEGIASEQSIFQLFTYEFIAGDKQHSLTEPFSIVLSETMAQKLFPDGNAVGKTVLIEKKFNLKVTGVYRNLPLNSILCPSYIVSLSSLEKTNEDVRNSMNGNYMTFVLLKPSQNYHALNQKIWDLFKGYNSYVADEKIKLCPLPNLHLSFNNQDALITILRLYNMIGIFILLLAAFNYINLTTANSSVRAKEIGVRKLHGSNQWILTGQFIGETLILAIIAVNLAFFFTELLLPTFNFIVQKQLSLSYTTNWRFILKTALIAVVTGLLAGVYPAVAMSSQRIINLFRGNMFKTRRETFSVKKLLVTFQFSISIFLIILSLTFTFQIRYLINKDLGFTKDNILYATINVTRKNTSYEILRNRILQHPEILNCAMSHHVPFVSFGGGTINWEGCIPGDVMEIRNNTVSYDFINNFDIKIVEGRGFSREFAGDIKKACLINETAKKCFGYDNPIGKHIDNGKLTIVGVTNDYHYKDMYNTIEPAVLELTKDTIRTANWTFSFRIAPGKINAAKKSITQELETYFPDDPFEVKVLSAAFRTHDVFRILASIDNSLMFFTVLNVLLASIGLLGLVSFTTQRRTKEIGVRKITGSSSLSIFMLLTREYFVLLVIASLISWPFGYISYVYMPGNYKMDFPFWLFGFATGIILVIALATSFYHTLKAAYKNPVDALRYE